MDCIFCGIIKGNVPSYTIYEDDMFNVFLDIYPAALGHALIVPKEHCVDIFDLPHQYASQMLPVAQKIANAMKDSLGCDGINILQNNGRAAGQAVFHYHMHLIPRYSNDNTKVGWVTISPSDDELKTTHKKLKTRIG